MSNAIIIPARSFTVSSKPRVTVTTPRKGAAVRIAFNPALVEKAELGEVTHLAIEHDAEKKHLKFRPSEVQYEGTPAHKLQVEGKRTEESAANRTRMLLMPREALGFLPVRPYEVHFLRSGVFAIHYGDAE